jgi:hypothetical protein
MITNNEATCKRTYTLNLFGFFQKKSKNLGCKGAIQTLSIIKHIVNITHHSSQSTRRLKIIFIII